MSDTNKLNLKPAEEMKKSINAEQRKRIKKVYSQAAKEIGELATKFESIDKGTSELRAQRYRILENQIRRTIKKLGTDIHSGIESDIYNLASVIVDCNNAFLKKVGMTGGTLFSGVPDSVVKAITTGQVYDSGWSLSKRIWTMSEKNMQDIHSIIAKGVAENKSTYDIAKDLEKYVDPKAAKQWDWSKVYPGTTRKIDYNAQRLARTLVQHGYQQAFVETTIKNPFVTEYEWRSACIPGRTCQLCLDRHGQRFKKDELPLDHPNGLCTVLAVIPQSLDDIANQLGDWTKSSTGTYPEIDSWYSSMVRKW